MWVRARVMTQMQLGLGRLSRLTSYCSPCFTPPRWLGAGVTQALGSSEMGLSSASGDLLQGEGAEQDFLSGGNTGLWRWSQPCRGPGPSPRAQLSQPT